VSVSKGFKTSEFWVTIVTTLVFAFWPDMPAEALLATVGYVVSRGLSKFSGNAGQ